MNIATCFETSASSAGSLKLLFVKVTKLLKSFKLELNERLRALFYDKDCKMLIKRGSCCLVAVCIVCTVCTVWTVWTVWTVLQTVQSVQSGQSYRLYNLYSLENLYSLYNL